MERINQFLRELTGADSECVSFDIPEAPKKMCNDLFSFQCVYDFIDEYYKDTSGDMKEDMLFCHKYIDKMMNYVWDGIINVNYDGPYYPHPFVPRNNLAITVSGETHRLFVDLDLWICMPKYWHGPDEKPVKEEDYSVISLLLNLVNLTERDNNFKLALTNAMHDYGVKYTSSYSFILWGLEQTGTLPNDCIGIIIRFFWLCQFF